MDGHGYINGCAVGYDDYAFFLSFFIFFFISFFFFMFGIFNRSV